MTPHLQPRHRRHRLHLRRRRQPPHLHPRRCGRDQLQLQRRRPAHCHHRCDGDQRRQRQPNRRRRPHLHLRPRQPAHHHYRRHDDGWLHLRRRRHPRHPNPQRQPGAALRLDINYPLPQLAVERDGDGNLVRRTSHAAGQALTVTSGMIGWSTHDYLQARCLSDPRAGPSRPSALAVWWLAVQQRTAVRPRDRRGG